jgi:hypothetical protein
VTGGTVAFPSGSITNAQASAASPFDTDKTVHQHQPYFSQESATAATDGAFVVHVARNSGTVMGFQVGSVVACVGAAVVDFDLLKNGTSVLSAAKQLTSATAAYGSVSGALDAAEVAYVVGDVFEVSIDETTGGGTAPKGIFAQPTFDESYDS